MISDGHSIALSLGLIACLNEWIVHPSGSLGFNQLFMAARAGLALLIEPLLNRGDRELFPDTPSMARQTAYRVSPSLMPTLLRKYTSKRISFSSSRQSAYHVMQWHLYMHRHQ